MKHYRLLLVYGVILAWLALLSAVKAQQLSPVRIALAGTMEVVVVRDIGPAFTAATGYPVELTRAPSVQLANRIVKGEIKPDVYLNSDASVMELLMGPANNDRSRWYLPILRSRTVIAYSPNSASRTTSRQRGRASCRGTRCCNAARGWCSNDPIPRSTPEDIEPYSYSTWPSGITRSRA